MPALSPPYPPSPSEGGKPSLGIRRLESIHYYVRDLDRSRKLYCDYLDFAELGESSAELTASGKQKSLLFGAGDCRIIVSMPIGEGGRAWRYLRRHPDGIGTVVFEVEDIERTFKLLDQRGGTPIEDIQRFEGEGGKLATFSITTPFGDTTFRFVQRDGYKPFFPGYEPYSTPRGGSNAFGIEAFDHVTSNFQTMKPALLWMEHVMGFETYWDVKFHTKDVTPDRKSGSGLRSTVMWEPGSGVKFANNEPWRPFFKASQINVFNEDHRGDGVQHVALSVKDILSAVRGMRTRGVGFMPTPGTYYDMLPERLQQLGIGTIDEDIATLRELEILVDGEKKGAYMLQIFLKDAAGLYGKPEAGPFFYEIIQRKGDRGFGAGNFRALFESIERQQKAEGKI
jgi:4-hydroxyphenylpyruvate dioxygenase